MQIMSKLNVEISYMWRKNISIISSHMMGYASGVIHSKSSHQVGSDLRSF